MRVALPTHCSATAKRSGNEAPVRRHPYRSAIMNTTDERMSATEEAREDRIVLAVIALIGSLGVGIGVFAPDRTVEPALGIIILFFAALTFHAERARRALLARSRDTS